MLDRVTDIMKSSRMVRNLGRHQLELDKMQQQLATGRRISRPGDDPSAATNQMYFRTRVEELGQFEKNVGEAKARLNMVDGELARVTDILQRVRVLTVQAANGIYQGDNFFGTRHAIASEIDQHLRSMIEIANGRDSTGRSLFGGHLAKEVPFTTIQAAPTGARAAQTEEAIIGVRYNGDIGRHLRELERKQYIEVNVPGNHAFWATNMSITGSVDNGNYTSLSYQSFRIDGTEIQVNVGDGIDDIIQKINQAALTVQARKVGQNYISLSTSSPHQIWLEDVGNATVLKDIGLLSADPSAAPNEYAQNAQLTGMSLFAVMIKLRDDLRAGDILEIGGANLANLDDAVSNVLRHRTSVGARINRLEEHAKRISWDSLYMTELLAQSEGVDMPEVIMNLKWLESVHNYALHVGARIIRPQLMDFLR